ncbi:MAG: hypothetical protein PVH74_03840 [Desulfobacterales bacterium]|jgi:hypothetical protein|nr:hypothetical protein [Deltaproteobacteria bacterium]
MTFANMLNITSNAALSVLIWIVLFLLALYFARRPFHKVIMSFSKIIRNALRLTAASVLSAEKRLVLRNREVLMAAGLENSERIVEREFDRISAAVTRDLDGYPNVHRQLSELIVKLDEDYNNSADVPPSLPNWMPIIESIAKIEHSGDSMVANMLAEINRSLTEQNKKAIEDYRNSTAARHGILNKMMPFWRKVERSLDGIANSITNIKKRAKTVDRCMNDYEKIRAGSDKAACALSTSALTQFAIAGLVLLIAIGGAVINFNLIALPMSEMVGGASYIGPFKTSDVAGLVIILVELTMGLFLMESLRITRLFPIIGAMDDKLRHRMIIITFTLLAILAGVESALAFMRDRIAHDMEVLRQTLAGAEQMGMTPSIIPTVGQMVLGFILPFALAFVAIPLEMFVTSSRTVLGAGAAWLLRMLAFLLRLLGNIGFYAGRFIVNVYDLAIFPAIWLEGIILASKGKKMALAEGEIPEEDSKLAEEAVDSYEETIQIKEHQE